MMIVYSPVGTKNTKGLPTLCRIPSGLWRRRRRPSVAAIDTSVTESGYELIVARPAAHAIAETLPEAVSAAVIDFITGSLIDNPRRVGRELRNELAGIHSARRGTYRVLYRIDEIERTITVLRVDHRGDVYRAT